MSRLPPPWLAWSVALVTVAAVLVPSALSASRSAGRARDAMGTLETTLRDARVIVQARAAIPAGSSDGLAEAVIAALSAAGLPASALESLTPDPGSDRSFGGASPVERRRATLTLRGTLPQAGRLMEVWPRLAPGWTITAADLSPLEQRGREASTQTSGPLPLRVMLTLEGVFAEQDGV